MTPTPLPPERMERLKGFLRDERGLPLGAGPDLLSHIAYLEGEVVAAHEGWPDRSITSERIYRPEQRACWRKTAHGEVLVSPRSCPICTAHLTRQTPDPTEPGA